MCDAGSDSGDYEEIMMRAAAKDAEHPEESPGKTNISKMSHEEEDMSSEVQM